MTWITSLRFPFPWSTLLGFYPFVRAFGARTACGCGSVGRASPCQGEGRGFESRHPLANGNPSFSCVARWVGREARQRPAKPYTRVRIPYPPRAIGAGVARFLHTEEVTGSIPVSPTTLTHYCSSAPTPWGRRFFVCGPCLRDRLAAGLRAETRNSGALILPGTGRRRCGRGRARGARRMGAKPGAGPWAVRPGSPSRAPMGLRRRRRGGRAASRLTACWPPLSSKWTGRDVSRRSLKSESDHRFPMVPGVYARIEVNIRCPCVP